MTASRWAGRLARAVSGVVVLGAVGAVVAVADVLPAPAPPQVAPMPVKVAPARTTLVCPGPLQQPEASAAGGFDSAPVEPVLRVRGLSVPSDADADADAAPGAMTLLGDADPTRELSGRDALTGVVSDGPAAVLLQGEAPEGGVARLAGATSVQVAAGDLRGLAAAGCQAPRSDMWLVGGSTEIGSSAFLVVDNPGTTPADVAVELWGPAGPVELAGAAHYLVAPGAQRVVVLSGVAAEQRRLVAHLTSAGGAVTAYLQDSRLRGFTAAGTDLVSPGSAPAARQVVPGVVVEPSTVDDLDQPVLRVLAPGGDTTARLTLLGEEGPVTLPGADEVELSAGTVTDVPLGGLPAGAYTVVVDAEEPIVAAAMLVRAGAPGELDPTPTLERAWAAASTPVAAGTLAVPVGASSTVLLARTPLEGETGGAGRVVLRAYGAQGETLGEQSVEVGERRTVRVPVADLGDGVAGVEVLGASEDPVWATALLAEVQQPDGVLAAVLAPAPAAPGPAQVRVRQGATLGLR